MAGLGGRRPGAGRPKGALNGENAEIREMIIGALSQVGGQAYLAERAITHPVAFLALIGRVLPLQVAAAGDRPLVVDFKWADEVETTAAEAQPRTIDVETNDQDERGVDHNQSVPRLTGTNG